jgi:hypothetical protein
MDLELSASLGADMDLDLSTSGTVEMEYDGADKDAPAIHTVMDIKYEASAAGDSMSDKASTEMYTVTGDDKVTVYVQDPTSKNWSMTESELQENPIDEETMKKIREEIADVMKNGEVEKKAETVDGEECWVLKLNTNADAYIGVYDIMLDAVGEEAKESMEEAGVDKAMIENYLSYINMDMTVYASTKTGQLVKMDVDMSQMDTEGLLNQVNDDFGMLFGFIGVDLSSASLDISKLSFSTTFSDINNVEVEVPDKVVEEAEAAFGGNTNWDMIEEPIEGNEEIEEELIEDVEAEAEEEEEGEVPANTDGSYSLCEYNDDVICDVFARDGFKLDPNWSSPQYLCFEAEDGWESYSVDTTNWLNVDDAMAEGEKEEADGAVYYTLTGEDEDKRVTVKTVIDLGIDYNGSPVYAICDGMMNEDNTELSYATYSLCFRYNGDDEWVEVTLYEDDIEDWKANEYREVFEEIFR